MERESNGFAWILVIVLVIWALNLRSNIKELKSDLSYAEDRLEAVSDDLIDTEDRLNLANDQIQEAQGYAWGTYTEMGFALDNLSIQ